MLKHISALIQSLFAQSSITLLNLTAKLIIQQLCNFHIISIWPQRKKRTTLLLLLLPFCCCFKQFDISLETAGITGSRAVSPLCGLLKSFVIWENGSRVTALFTYVAPSSASSPSASPLWLPLHLSSKRHSNRLANKKLVCCSCIYSTQVVLSQSQSQRYQL